MGYSVGQPEGVSPSGCPTEFLTSTAIAAATGEPESSVSNPPLSTLILARALHESADVAHGYIGTEHLLLAAACAPVDVLVG